jgi:hypothetical protein
VPGAQSELVLGSDKVDIDGPVRIGRHQRVVGVSYATETRKVEFFDPELAKLRENLGKLFPAGTQIGFVTAPRMRASWCCWPPATPIPAPITSTTRPRIRWANCCPSARNWWYEDGGDEACQLSCP